MATRRKKIRKSSRQSKRRSSKKGRLVTEISDGLFLMLLERRIESDQTSSASTAYQKRLPPLTLNTDRVESLDYWVMPSRRRQLKPTRNASAFAHRCHFQTPKSKLQILFGFIVTKIGFQSHFFRNQSEMATFNSFNTSFNSISPTLSTPEQTAINSSSCKFPFAFATEYGRSSRNVTIEYFEK